METTCIMQLETEKSERPCIPRFSLKEKTHFDITKQISNWQEDITFFECL